MPHRQYHERFWASLASLSGLKELELWMKQSAIIDETMETCCIQGIEKCKGLIGLRIERDSGELDEVTDRELLASDKEFEHKVNILLSIRR